MVAIAGELSSCPSLTVTVAILASVAFGSAAKLIYVNESKSSWNNTSGDGVGKENTYTAVCSPRSVSTIRSGMEEVVRVSNSLSSKLPSSTLR